MVAPEQIKEQAGKTRDCSSGWVGCWNTCQAFLEEGLLSRNNSWMGTDVRARGNGGWTVAFGIQGKGHRVRNKPQKPCDPSCLPGFNGNREG